MTREEHLGASSFNGLERKKEKKNSLKCRGKFSLFIGRIIDVQRASTSFSPAAAPSTFESSVEISLSSYML
jgi:hypothetical protein